MKVLSKKITDKMTKPELTKYKRLQKEHKKAVEDMVKAQAKSTQYSRKIYHTKTTPTAAQKKKDQNLVDAGFRAEYFAFKKADEYFAYEKKMYEKYA